MDDPYSTAWLQSDPISLNLTKTPKSPKKINFFSQAGKIRLSRIWDDNLLDVERLFTGIDEPSEAYVREKVSDYVQHYLFQRARRLSLDRKATTVSTGILRCGKEKNKFWEYEDFISAKNLKHDQLRESHEIDRITELLMTGKIRYAPQGFDEILNNPIYKANRLLESVKKLERSEIKVEVLPFEIRVKKIRNVNQIPTNANSKTTFSNNDTMIGVDVENGKNVNSEFETFSPLSSAEFQENSSPVSIITLGTPRTLPSSSTPHEDREYFVEFPSSDYDRGRSSIAVLSNLSDQDLEAFAEKQFENEEVTGDLEISAEFSWEHPPLALAKRHNDCNTMYKTASDIVQMFQRQKVAGNEFMEYFSLNYLNGK